MISESEMNSRLPRVLLVGEANPYGGDPSYALFPRPKNCAGWNLCYRILGISDHDYLRLFERRNLCHRYWTVTGGDVGMRKIISESRLPVFVLFGRKVATAWARACGHCVYKPFAIENGPRQPAVLFLPHPSGRCRAWNRPGAYQRARIALLEIAPWLAPYVKVVS